MRKKNILITGGAGYIGSHTVQAFLDKNYQVVVLDNLSTGYREAIPSEAKFIKGDIHDTSLLKKTMVDNAIDAIIHFAAMIIVPESIDEPLVYYHNNTGGVLSVLEACRQVGVSKIVFSSTAAVYGNAGPELLTEQFPIAPINPYGNSKYFSECMIRDCDRPFNLRSVVLRYFNVAGASSRGNNGQRSKKATHLIKLASEAATGHRPFLDITGTDYKTPDGTGVRDYIHVEDLAEIHTLAFEYLDQGGASNVFNCGYGKGYSVKEVISTMKQVSKKDFQVREAPRRPGDADSLVADNQKIKDILNWRPTRDSLELICRSAYEWEKNWRQSL